MQPTSSSDYKQLLTDVIKKQIVILGPDITLSKARNVKGLTVADDGTVTAYVGSPQEVTQALIDQFVQLSGLIVKKTMEPLLLATQPQPSPAPAAQTPAPQPQQPVNVAPPSAPAPEPSVVAAPMPEPTQPTPPASPAMETMNATSQVAPTPQPPVQPQEPAQPVSQVNQTQEVKQPAENPLAA